MGKQAIIGFELNENEAQLCRYDFEKEDAVSIMVTVGGSMSAFPAVLSCITETGKWNYGIEAEFMAKHKDAVLIDSILEKCSRKEKIAVGEREYGPAEILSFFIAGALSAAGIREPKAELGMLVISVPETTKRFAKNAAEAFSILGITGKAFIQDKDESFFYHTLFQKVEVHSGKVGLFRFRDAQRVDFSSLNINRGTRPITVSIDEEKSWLLPEDDSEKDESFSEFIKECFRNENFSGAFIVGKAFDKNLAAESMRLLCRGQRHVFYGDNLFAKGACYAAYVRNGGGRLKDYLFLGKDIVRKNISIDMVVDGKLMVYPLVIAGRHWYEADKTIEFISDDTGKVQLNISSMDTGTRSHISINTSELPKRPAGTTRLKLDIKFNSPDSCSAKVTDLGFGELFPASGMAFKEMI